MGGSPVGYTSLSDIAHRQLTLMTGAGAPLYVVGAITIDGPARWVFLGLGLFMAVTPFFRPGTFGSFEAPLALVTSTMLLTMWGWTNIDRPHLVAASLGALIIYTALMAPRPLAEIGLGLLPTTYVLTPIVHGIGLVSELETIAIAVTNAAMGVLLLRIRVLTERRASEHTAAMSAVNRRLEELNRTDPLTGLANRRTLDQALTAAWTEGRLTGRPVGFLMIDIDHFKHYNDRYGHPVGDACLRLIAATLRDCVRDTDLVARYGGEEFSIVVPGADPAMALRLAERVRSAVAELRLEHAASPDGLLSVSVGVATVVPDVDDPEALVRAADHALYDAKNRGRNRVCA